GPGPRLVSPGQFEGPRCEFAVRIGDEEFARFAGLDVDVVVAEAGGFGRAGEVGEVDVGGGWRANLHSELVRIVDADRHFGLSNPGASRRCSSSDGVTRY